MTRNIGIGAWGDDVRALQEMLNLRGYNLKVDGIFGVRTRQAVISFQESNHDVSGAPLVVDGIVGPRTWKALTYMIEPTADMEQQVQSSPPNIMLWAALALAAFGGYFLLR